MIPVYEPYTANNQLEYVLDAINSNQLSYHGKYHGLFKHKLSAEFGLLHTTLTCNGTVSLYSILKCLNLPAGSKVLTPSLTYAATNSAIIHAGLTPKYINKVDIVHTIDEIEDSYDPDVKALMLVPLFSLMNPHHKEIKKFCKEKDIILIEDAAEAFYCHEYNGRLVGRLGKAASFSFFANKTITSGGEGGCIVTDDAELSFSLESYINHNHIGGYIHAHPGMNFRMTNIQAAIGYAQLEDIANIRYLKRNVRQRYLENLNVDKWHVPITYSDKSPNSVPWMNIVVSRHCDDILSKLKTQDIFEFRTMFQPNHTLPGFANESSQHVDGSKFLQNFPRTVVLPSHPNLSIDDQCKIINYLNDM